MENYKIIIIGAGILGCSIARELSKYHVDTLVLEKENDVGEGATKTNSGLLAAGFHARGGSLKGIATVHGNQMYQDICRELNVKVDYIGSLYVAFSEKGIELITKKYENGIKNGVPDMRFVDGDEARKIQPGLSPNVIKALYAPTTGIVDTYGLLIKTAQNSCENGVTYQFHTKVVNIERDHLYTVHTDHGDFKAEYIINTAGEGADIIESYVRPADLVIKPRRGQFILLDKDESHQLKHVIYQAQDSDEKGCLITPSVEGNIIIGPTSENVASYDRVETTQAGIHLMERVAKKIMPDLEMGRVITTFAGVRTNISNVIKEEKDFIIRRSADKMVSALGIKNPGLTAAPYLSLKILDILKEDGLILEKKSDFNPYLKTGQNFLTCNKQEQSSLFEQDHRYGNIICRCENITEGDIIRVLNEPLPPNNLNGLKKRLRVSMGACQGNYCIPRIIEILSRELKVRPEDILKGNKGSNLVKGRLK